MSNQGNNYNGQYETVSDFKKKKRVPGYFKSTKGTLPIKAFPIALLETSHYQNTASYPFTIVFAMNKPSSVRLKENIDILFDIARDDPKVVKSSSQGHKIYGRSKHQHRYNNFKYMLGTGEETLRSYVNEMEYRINQTSPSPPSESRRDKMKNFLSVFTNTKPFIEPEYPDASCSYGEIQELYHLLEKQYGLDHIFVYQGALKQFCANWGDVVSLEDKAKVERSEDPNKMVVPSAGPPVNMRDGFLPMSIGDKWITDSYLNPSSLLDVVEQAKEKIADNQEDADNYLEQAIVQILPVLNFNRFDLMIKVNPSLLSSLDWRYTPVIITSASASTKGKLHVMKTYNPNAFRMDSGFSSPTPSVPKEENIVDNVIQIKKDNDIMLENDDDDDLDI